MKRSAFTLVELSIVLVILGLLIGGVLTGQSLIRAAELRSISTQHARFVTAVHTFRDKYMGLPGDLTNATTYWGIADATPATCVMTSTNDSKTCNGNGDGMIGMNGFGGEIFRFWQHLTNAGLVEGTYSGIRDGTGISAATALNSPPGKLSGSFWFTVYQGAVVSDGRVYDGEYGNILKIGKLVADASPSAAIIKPEEAYNIDMKTDDGKPATGKLVTDSMIDGAAGRCTDGANGTVLTANYRLNNTSTVCALVFRQQF